MRLILKTEARRTRLQTTRAIRAKDKAVLAPFSSSLLLLLTGCAVVAAPVIPTPALEAQSIPAAALMKYQPSGTTNYVFNSSVMLAPPVYPADASPSIQTAINAMASANLSKGGAIFLAPGTYLLKHSLKIQGSGVTLVGVRAVTSSGQNGAYPSLEYDDTLVDADYEGRSATESSLGYDVPLIDTPAAVRFNGSSNYATTSQYSYGGILGINIAFVGTAGSLSEGDKATALAINIPHQALFRDISITNAAQGLDVGPCTSPYFRQISISGFRGPFGARLGDPSTAALKMHALTVAAASTNTTGTLVIIQQNMELMGAHLTGGGVGISITGPSTSNFADDIYIRSVQIQNTAKQGILIGYAEGTYLSDTTITSAGAEAIKVLPGFYGGLAITNLRATYSGLSGVRVQQGMNINLVNAILENSGQNKSIASSADLPIADLSVDSSVTALNVAGGQFGSVSGTTLNEDWGMYVSTAAPLYTPWHTPTLVATNIDFLSLPAASQASGITVSNVGQYSTLNGAGYFNAPLEDSWTIQGLPTDPVLTGAFAVVKGFNSYDLPEIRDRQWINLLALTTSGHQVVDSSGNINSTAFAYWEPIIATAYPEGAVLYLPAGTFNTGFTTWTRKIYNLAGTLTINQPALQFVGDGRDVTQITNTNATPTANSIQLVSGSTNSGIFGLSIFYSKTAALTAPGTAVAYAPPFLVQNTSKVRLSNIGVHYSMGGGVSMVDTTNSEIFDADMAGLGGNNSQPTVPLGIYTVTATTNESTSDIRFYQAYGEFLENIWMPSSSSFCSSTIACSLPASQIPDFEWIRLEGGVLRFRSDNGTLIEGKTGFQAVSNSGGTPHEISSFKFATDHVYTYGVDLQQATDVDFVEPWMNARVTPMFLESGVSGNVRLSTEELRGGAFEGAMIQGGTTVSVVNCQVGNNANLWSPYNTMQTRPLSGIYIGSGVGSATFVGGMNGWIANSSYANASTNNNSQNWGVILGTGFPTSHYAVYGTDLYGNLSGKVGQQVSSGTGATVVVPN